MSLSKSEKVVIDKGASEAGEPSKKLTTKLNCLQNPHEDLLTEVNLYFCTSALPLFSNYNLFLQRGDPLAHKVYPITKGLDRKIAMRFMKADAFQVNDITVNLIDDPENYLPFQEILVSFTTKNLLKNYSMMVKLISYNAIMFWRQHLHFTKKV